MPILSSYIYPSNDQYIMLLKMEKGTKKTKNKRERKKKGRKIQGNVQNTYLGVLNYIYCDNIYFKDRIKRSL